MTLYHYKGVLSAVLHAMTDDESVAICVSSACVIYFRKHYPLIIVDISDVLLSHYTYVCINPG